jgi:hypothetical protein
VAFHVPSSDRLPLPSGLIAAESDGGQQLLEEHEYLTDYESLARTFETQSRPGYCGVASAVAVVNALHDLQPRLTQSTFFTKPASKVRASLQVTFGGMSLGQLAALLRAHGLEATVSYASDTNLETFRAMAKQNLRTEGDMLLVNYQRAVLGQEEMGHISPIAAYNAATDRLLVLDVATYKYPPVWVSTEAMWRAMSTTDSASGRTRGFVVVRRAQQKIPLDVPASAMSPQEGVIADPERTKHLP